MRKLHRRTLSCWLFAVPVGGLGLACGDEARIVQRGSDQVLENGSLSLALTARGDSGALYRLRDAELTVASARGDVFIGLSTELDPDSTTLEADLRVGLYEVFLEPGWRLERVLDGQVETVSARLLSSDVQGFEISAGEETRVTYRFETNGEIIEIGSGHLVVSIDVEEQAPPPELELGPPFVIQDGQVFSETNAVGLEAVLYTALAPLGSSLELLEQDGRICMQGVLGPVIDDDFANMWGAEVGLAFVEFSDLPEPSEGAFQAPWEVAQNGVVGLSYRVTGDLLPPLRVAALPAFGDPDLDHHCSARSPIFGAPDEVLFEELDRQCWLAERDPLTAASLNNIGWTLPADFLEHPFSFCIEDIRPVLVAAP